MSDTNLIRQVERWQLRDEEEPPEHDEDVWYDDEDRPWRSGRTVLCPGCHTEPCHCGTLIVPADEY